MSNLDDEWELFLDDETVVTNDNNIENNYDCDIAPDCEELYISTKTKVLFLNQDLDLNSIFWQLKVYEYNTLSDGIIKKQMKIVSTSVEDYNDYKEKIKNIPYYKENIIKQIDNPSARIVKFKDERKITIGISNKDIINFRGKQKNAFYNCFALIFRLKYNSEYKEIHVKVFNTGKLEMPGVVNNDILNIVKKLLIDNIQPYINSKLDFKEDCSDENVLINSNFNCRFYINRDKLHNILSTKYSIETAFDPCSYPGVKCKYYFNNEKDFNTNDQTGRIDVQDNDLKMSDLNETVKYTGISIMIFRTGSCLIVGNCSEKVLKFVFNFIKNILRVEYLNIRAPNEKSVLKTKTMKLKKRKITVTNDYYKKLTNK
tara:strand:+ start:635 stop:1750 length:1116 start_codon:yes stop_codon:yes gene_type:complete